MSNVINLLPFAMPHRPFHASLVPAKACRLLSRNIGTGGVVARNGCVARQQQWKASEQIVANVSCTTTAKLRPPEKHHQHLYGNPQLAQPAPPTEQKHRAPQRQRNKNGSYLDGLYSPLRVQLRHPLLVFSPVVVVVVDHVPPLQGEWSSRKGMLVRAAACGMSIISGKEIVATMPGQKVHI